jgi:hypothetical protein
LSDELFLCNAKAKAARQAAFAKRSLRTRSNLPHGEVALSAGKDRRENFKHRLPQPTATNRKGAAGNLAAPFFRLSGN